MVFVARKAGQAGIAGLQTQNGSLTRFVFGAGDRARTGDLFLGKETFYQLNYTRRL